MNKPVVCNGPALQCLVQRSSPNLRAGLSSFDAWLRVWLQLLTAHEALLGSGRLKLFSCTLFYHLLSRRPFLRLHTSVSAGAGML